LRGFFFAEFPVTSRIAPVQEPRDELRRVSQRGRLTCPIMRRTKEG
jgi:hypothetical protein